VSKTLEKSDALAEESARNWSSSADRQKHSLLEHPDHVDQHGQVKALRREAVRNAAR
jgi:hypothetical protein